MPPHITLYTQPGCLSCELMRVFLEAREFAFEERDISADPAARQVMTEMYDSYETPTVVVSLETTEEVVVGFDPDRLDQLLSGSPSSDSVTES